MNRLIYAFISLCALCFVSCDSGASIDVSKFTTSIYAPKYAAGFEILALPDTSAMVLKISKPWQGATNNNHHLLISKDDNVKLKDFRGASVVDRAQRLVCVSSSTIAMLDVVGQSECVVGVSGIDYISNPAIQQSFTDKRLLDIGYGANLNFEAILSLRSDLVLLYGVSGEESSVVSKFDELGIEYIYIGEYAEELPLGKAEWVVALGAIVGELEQSVEVFNAVEARYNGLKEYMAAQSPKRPRVMLNTPYRDVWYMPSSSSYMAQLIEDAGGEYIYKGNTSASTQPISLEEAYQLVSQSDRWINVGAVTRSIDDLKGQNPIFADMKVVRDGEIYNTTARTTPAGGSDFWESGVVSPDVILADLATILHPDIDLGHTLYYYERLR